MPTTSAFCRRRRQRMRYPIEFKPQTIMREGMAEKGKFA
jgi:hypothetical protein